VVLDQAVKAGDDYDPAKCGPTGLSQTQPLEEEEGKGKKDKDSGYLKGNPDSNSHRRSGNA
jgi:hypothetical protein